ncbi:MAG TPA: PQQ-dependent sugar dehydrogenase [Croceibacterium sp.]
MVRNGAVAAMALLLAASAQAQQADIGIKPVELTQPSYTFDTAEQHGIKVSVLAKGFARPFAIEFLPGGDLLMVERGTGLRLLRGATGANPQLDAELVAGMPTHNEGAFSVGVQDVKLHPDFASNHWIYWTYNDPTPRPADSPPNQRPAKLKLMRGKLENGRVSQVETLLEGGIAPALGSRLAFSKDGTLYVTTGGAFGDLAQDLGTIYGKVLRLNADGTIPADNPFVGRAGANPAIYSYGHRDQHGLMVHPESGAVLNAEHGMNGGDEVNLILPGANYGWPTYTFSRQYDGAQGSAQPTADGIGRPLILWSPSIAPTGLMIYQGDKFPAWKGNLFVGSGRRGEIAFTGGLERVVLGADMGDVRRETLLTELHQRVRDFAEGPDGLIYVLTDGNENAVLRIEPSAP